MHFHCILLALMAFLVMAHAMPLEHDDPSLLETDAANDQDLPTDSVESSGQPDKHAFMTSLSQTEALTVSN